MQPRIEHANITVRDIEATTRFLLTAFPEFRVRCASARSEESRWAHVGTEQHYIALNEATAESAEEWAPYSGKPGVNHLGFEVDDVEAVRLRLTGAGYRDSTPPNGHPFRRRVYFADADGNDWEFVQYSSSDPAERNDYSIPD
jgi:catechol 2,3-dioxygenase-like lactoylglutathione lyase family enzyme